MVACTELVLLVGGFALFQPESSFKLSLSLLGSKRGALLDDEDYEMIEACIRLAEIHSILFVSLVSRMPMLAFTGYHSASIFSDSYAS